MVDFHEHAVVHGGDAELGGVGGRDVDLVAHRAVERAQEVPAGRAPGAGALRRAAPQHRAVGGAVGGVELEGDDAGGVGDGQARDGQAREHRGKRAGR